MKRKDVVTLLAYSIPWAFLMLWGDEAHGWGWHYAAIIACMAVLAGWGVRTNGIFLAGNVLSLGTSLLCVWLSGYGEMSHYFKPFGAFGSACLLTMLSALIQWLVWKKEWQVLGLLTAVIGLFLASCYWLLVTM